MMRARAAAALLMVSAAIIRADQQPVFRAGVDVVRIDVSVMNGLNPVADLKAGNFVVTDNGVPQKLDSVSLDTVPAESYAGARHQRQPGGRAPDELDRRATGLVKSLREEDAVSLMTFSEPVLMAVKATRDRAPLLAALGRPEGGWLDLRQRRDLPGAADAAGRCR